MRNVYIDTTRTNLHIHSIVTPLDFMLQMPLEGLDMPAFRNIQYDRPGEDGGVISSQFYGPRTVTLHGILQASSNAQFEADRAALSTALSISKDSNGYPQPIRCQVETLAGNIYFFDAYVATKPVYDQTDVNLGSFLIQLVVTNPYLSGGSQVTSGLITRATGGGFILPVILPIVSSSNVGGTGTITNAGNITSMPIIKLTGKLTNPFIRNVANNKILQLNYTINGGDVVTVDMLNKTIMLNSTSPILSAKTSDSTWWGIEPGSNQINFSSGSSSDTGTLEITFYSAYLGA